MGNTIETAFFIKENGDPEAYHRFEGKRTDSIYLRTTENINLVSIGLCSAITTGARAFVSIVDLDTSKELSNQTLELIIGRNRQTSYYTLDNPVVLKKGKIYSLSVEVFGGPTFTFLDIQKFSTQRDLTLEISKEIPAKLNLNTEATTASESDLSTALTPSRKSKTEQIRAFLVSDGKTKTQISKKSTDTTPTARKSAKGKVFFSQTEISEGKEAVDSPKRVDKTASGIFGCLTKSTRMNQISGILFTRANNFTRVCF